MDSFIIEGPKKLNGTVKISGSKNAALPILTACLAKPAIYNLKNIPNLKDTRTMLQLLKITGAKILRKKDSILIDTRKCDNPEAPYDLVKTMRASFYVLGPLLSRFGYAKVSMPGGCAWGPRPIDYHLTAFESLGAKVTLKSGYIITEGHLKANTIKFPKPSVGATGNIIMACSNLNQHVTIINAAKEPEIVDLCKFLEKTGVSFKGIGTSELTIIGTSRKIVSHINYTVIPDRIEAGTFLIACAAAGGDITLKDVRYDHLLSVVKHLKDIGMKISNSGNTIRIISDSTIKSKNLKTDVYPGFPTDLQAQWISLMAISNGTCQVEDTIYIDRFTHVPELNRLGANIEMKNNIATIKGVPALYAASIMCTDIRASASLIIASICAEGISELSRIYHIDRGYELIEDKFAKIGVTINRINKEDS